MIEKHISNLGLKTVDRVTGFKGVITSVSFDLYGCIQCVVSPSVKEDGSTIDGKWFDLTRLDIFLGTRVLALPDFDKGKVAEGKKGCAEKPDIN